MSKAFRITPDPDHPVGGYARLYLPGDDPRDPSAEASPNAAPLFLRDAYADRYLGDSGWQSVRVTLTAEGSGRDGQGSYLTLGPAVLEAVTAFTPIEITLGQHQGMITWPGDLPRLPPAARRHELRATRNRPATPAAPVEPSEDPPSEITADPVGGPRRPAWPLYLAGALVTLAVAGGAAYLLWPERMQAPALPKDPAVSLETCTRAALLAGGPSYREAMEAMAACENIDPNTALAVLRWGEGAGSADALMALGRLYDAAVTDSVYEYQIGIRFEPDPSLAAGYYAAAKGADAPGAEEALKQVCTVLQRSPDSLSEIAFTEHCNEAN